MGVQPSRAVSTAMLFAAGISLGLFFSLNRVASTGGIPFIASVFWMSLGAGLLTLIVALATNKRPRLSAAHLRIYVVFGTVGMALPYLLLAFVAPKLPAGIVGLQQTLVPVITYIFALFFRIDRLDALKLAGLAVGLAGVLLVVLPQASLPEQGMAGWVLLSLLVPVSFALSNVLAAVLRPPETPSLALSAGMLLAGALFLFPVMASTGSWWWFEGPMDSTDWALVGITVINALFFFLLLEIIRRAGPVFFSIQNYIATLSGIGWGIVLLGEGHSAWIWGSLGLLFIALTLVVRGSARGTQPPGNRWSGIRCRTRG